MPQYQDTLTSEERKEHERLFWRRINNFVTLSFMCFLGTLGFMAYELRKFDVAINTNVNASYNLIWPLLSVAFFCISQMFIFVMIFLKLCNFRTDCVFHELSLYKLWYVNNQNISTQNTHLQNMDTFKKIKCIYFHTGFHGTRVFFHIFPATLILIIFLSNVSDINNQSKKDFYKIAGPLIFVILLPDYIILLIGLLFYWGTKAIIIALKAVYELLSDCFCCCSYDCFKTTESPEQTCENTIAPIVTVDLNSNTDVKESDTQSLPPVPRDDQPPPPYDELISTNI